ncbi:hypothetical protein MRX96_053982 [Rhipicephalus microplus]
MRAESLERNVRGRAGTRNALCRDEVVVRGVAPASRIASYTHTQPIVRARGFVVRDELQIIIDTLKPSVFTAGGMSHNPAE